MGGGDGAIREKRGIVRVPCPDASVVGEGQKVFGKGSRN